jgi:hypothetical protein
VGAAAAEAEVAKRVKYADLEAAYEVVPVAVETLGVWDHDAWKLIEAIGRRVGLASGDQRSTVFLRQRIAVAVQRGNSIAVLGTLKHFIPFKSYR